MLTNVNDRQQKHWVIAAFDIGSNTVKMTVARREDDGSLTEFHWRSATVRLGTGIEATGRLAGDRIAAAMTALSEFAAEARSNGATRLIGVATEATRVAANGREFLDRLRDEVGLEVATITGDREAELTFRGLQVQNDLQGDIVIADIGGGSTEVIIAVGGEFQSGRSIPLGSGRLTDRFVHSDPPTTDEIDSCRDAAGRMIDELNLPQRSIDRLIVVGGTGEYLTRLVPLGIVITNVEIDGVIDRMLRTTAADLANDLIIQEQRARVLPAGVAVVQAFARRLNPSAVEGAKSGIRTGLLLAAFAGEI